VNNPVLWGVMRVLTQLQGTGVRISIVFPPDVDTPGFAQENLIKVCVGGGKRCVTRSKGAAEHVECTVL
jgi:hypothetical protein